MKIITISTFFLFFSCAGPVSPLGSSNLFVRSKILSNVSIVEDKPLYLFHRPYSLKLNNDVNPDQLFIRMGKQVLPLKEFTNFDPEALTIYNIKFNPYEIYDFEIFQKNEEKKVLSSQFSYPQCELGDKQHVQSWTHYHVNKVTQDALLNASQEFNVNSSLLAALVAQESSFRPQAVSWAKAVGLTQITPSAVRDLLANNQDVSSWPLNEKNLVLSYMDLKLMIRNGELNKNNDWRLDPKLSLKGGSAFLNKMNEYWSMSFNQRILNEKGISKSDRTKIILASYNSGAYRVKKQIKRHGKKWLSSKQLKEGRKYVQNILSYCYDFSKEEL